MSNQMNVIESSTKKVLIRKEDREFHSDLVIQELEDDTIRLILLVDEMRVIAEAYNCFDALIKIRDELEAHSVFIICNGSAVNVFPSGMAKSMGIGDLAYKLKLGKQALSSDLVNIFEYDDSLRVESVKNQRGFFERWIRSLG